MPTWKSIRPHDQFSVPINITKNMIRGNYMSDAVVLHQYDLVIVTEVVPPEDSRDPMGGYICVDSTWDNSVRDLAISPGLLRSPRDMCWTETIPDSHHWQRPALQLGYIIVKWDMKNSEYIMQRDYGPEQRIQTVIGLGRELQPALRKAWHYHRLMYRNDIIREELLSIRNRVDDLKTKYPDFDISGGINYSHSQIDNSLSHIYW